MAKFTDKISNLLDKQVPEFVLEDHPKFLEFLKSYYTFMESAEISVTSVQTTEGILLETETNQENSLILDGSRIDTDITQLDSGDKVILESSAFGKFTRGETVTGQTSGATATVLVEDLDNGRLYISSQNKFIIDETILGASSNASAVINNYRPNPVETIQQLLAFKDPDKVISNFLTKFRNEFLNTLPENLDDNVDKRNLIKNIKSLYRTKGTNRGHEVFFRLLFGLESETIYPREQLLKTSDGKWNTNKIVRCIATKGDTSTLVGRTIEGQTSKATAIIENVFKFQIGANEVTEFILNAESIQGTFTTGEEIRGTISDDSDVYIKANLTGIPDSITLTNDGANYQVNDLVSLTAGGEGAVVQVDTVGRGSINHLYVDDGGTNYKIGDDLVFNNTGTGGGSAEAKVAVVNGGFTIETSTSSTEDHIVLEDETVRGDSYTGNKIVQESGAGDITDLRIINQGSNYQSLPVVTVDDTNGSNATVFAYGTEIGKVQELKIIESGVGYQNSPSPPTLSLPAYILIRDLSGSFIAGDTITGLSADSSVVTAEIVTYNSSTQILKVKDATGVFANDSTITSSNSATATTIQVDQSTATMTIGTVADTFGSFLNQDGHISETTMKIQDSLLYQDFSYIIKVGRTINDWRDSFKKTMHSAGFYFTGQVNIESRISAQIATSVKGISSGLEESPIFNIINTLFSTIFGRRLGTEDDGTTLRTNAHLGVDPDFDATTDEHFTAGTRDLTLVHKMNIQMQNLVPIEFRGEQYKFGFAYAGPRLKSLDIYNNPFSASNIYSGNHPDNSTAAVSTNGTYVMPPTFAAWDDHRIIGLNSSLNGDRFQMSDYENHDNLKTYIAHPSIVTISGDVFTFDITTTTFDTTTKKFDATTP
jgi:hypothetical protein